MSDNTEVKPTVPEFNADEKLTIRNHQLRLTNLRLKLQQAYSEVQEAEKGLYDYCTSLVFEKGVNVKKHQMNLDELAFTERPVAVPAAEQIGRQG